jgi:predicted dehydrogenase
MSKPVRFGLIGVGGIGAYHRAAIEAQETAGAAQLVAVADPWADRLATQKGELEARGVRWHLDYHEMLRDEPALDAAVIATPIPFHFDMAMACIAGGLMIHLEKPPVPLLRQFEALVAADKKESISVGFQMIGARCTQLLKEAISAGKLGTITAIRAGGCWPRQDNYYSRANWAGRMLLDGAPVFDGPATNAFAHLIHNIMYFAGAERDEFAIPVEVTGELYRARPIESYDTACLRGLFRSGIQFSLAVTHATEVPLPFRMEVLGTQGWARLTEDGAKLESNVGVSCDCPQSTQELLDINHANFVDVLTGRASRYMTRLADTRGYVSATNAMLLSSGGIHNIDAASVRQYGKEGEAGFDVGDLRAAVEETFASGRLFNEQGIRWAIAKPETVRLPLDHGISQFPTVGGTPAGIRTGPSRQ